MADDVAELVRALRERLDDAELLHAQTCARIWVTAYAPEGVIVDVPYLDQDGRDTGQRQLLVSPNDWTAVESLASHHGADRVREAFGVPVVKDA